MRRVNPRYVLRNHVLQTAIERAERNDDSWVELFIVIFNHTLIMIYRCTC